MQPEIIFDYTDEQTTERITIESCEDKFFIEICDQWQGYGKICLDEEQILKLANSILINTTSKYLQKKIGR